MKNEMRNRMLNNFLKDLGSFIYWSLKQAVAIALVGAMCIMFYQAGRAEMFADPKNADEFCEQHEKNLRRPIDYVSLETKNENEGVVNEDK
jgi:hypothetical protein